MSSQGMSSFDRRQNCLFRITLVSGVAIGMKPPGLDRSRDINARNQRRAPALEYIQISSLEDATLPGFGGFTSAAEPLARPIARKWSFASQTKASLGDLMERPDVNRVTLGAQLDLEAKAATVF